MASLISVLAFNMKAQRGILGISQAQLAERVKTSTNYIALIEVGRKFPSFEMLERIATALEIDPPALFAAKIHPLSDAETMEKVQRQVLSDINQFVSARIKQLGQKPPQFPDPNTEEDGIKLV
jgi:transcriptional regulator with XRE-family HTH domain